MFNMGSMEIAMVVFAIVVFIGPKGIPKLVKDVRGWIKSLRSLASELTSSFDDMVKDTEFKEAADLFKDARNFNPRQQLSSLMDPDGKTQKVFKEFDAELKEVSSETKAATQTTSGGTTAAGQTASGTQPATPKLKRRNALLDEANSHLETLESKSA